MSCSDAGAGGNEIMLFGVRINVEHLRKAASTNDSVDRPSPDANMQEKTAASSTVNPADPAAAPVRLSSDDHIHGHTCTSNSEPRKRGFGWSKEEHRLFLEGLGNAGKGNWKEISRKYVKTRSPAQVASHAQKHFLRHCAPPDRRRSRASIFDTISTGSGMQQVGGGKMTVVHDPHLLPISKRHLIGGGGGNGSGNGSLIRRRLTHGSVLH